MTEQLLVRSLIHADDVLTHITEQRVKSALDAFLHGRCIPATDSLEPLVLVDEVLADPAFPPYLHRRTVALGSTLIALITKELVRHRRALGIRCTLSKTSIKDSIRAMNNDARTYNRELLGWSWLYYHYVRVELGIHPTMFCQMCHITDRTLRRYQNRALERLTQMLIEQEWQARQRKHSTIRN